MVRSTEARSRNHTPTIQLALGSAWRSVTVNVAPAPESPLGPRPPRGLTGHCLAAVAHNLEGKKQRMQSGDSGIGLVVLSLNSGKHSSPAEALRETRPCKNCYSLTLCATDQIKNFKSGGARRGETCYSLSAGAVVIRDGIAMAAINESTIVALQVRVKHCQGKNFSIRETQHGESCYDLNAGAVVRRDGVAMSAINESTIAILQFRVRNCQGKSFNIRGLIAELLVILLRCNLCNHLEERAAVAPDGLRVELLVILLLRNLRDRPEGRADKVPDGLLAELLVILLDRNPRNHPEERADKVPDGLLA